jgi:hypothetical protein
LQGRTIIEDVQQNSKHQQHSPGKENCATAKVGSFHRKNKGKKLDKMSCAFHSVPLLLQGWDTSQKR